MKKLFTILLACTLAATSIQVSAQAGQRRTAGTATAPKVSRTVATADDRSSASALRTRSVDQASGSFVTPLSAVTRGSGARRQLAAPTAVSSSLNVYGTVIYADSWSANNTPFGVYRLPVTDGAVSEKLFGVNSNPIYSFYDGDHSVYTMYELTYGSWVMGYDLYIFDTLTNQQSGIVEFDDLPIKATDVAYDTTTGKAYGLFSGVYYDEEYRYWGYIDIKARKVVAIANYNFSLRGVAIDKFGQAYGIGLDKVLYKIDKETGEATAVGNTGCPDLTYMTSAAFNDKDNNIILSYSNDTAGGLVAIDPATATSAPVSTFTDNDEVIGLYIPFQAPDKAPATPSLAVSCAEGSMTVAFTVTMPTMLFDGSDAAGADMGYKIYANGTEILSGSSKAGETVTVSKTLTVSGNTNFVAVATNDAGESNQAKASCYVGKGTPAATKGVTLTYADGSFTLTWDAVTESADGGFVAADEISYDIVDAEGAVVAAGIKQTSWTKAQTAPDEITGFAFGVVAKYDGKASKTVMSNSIYLGHYSAPVEIDLTNKDTFGQHSVADINADGKTWIFNSKNGAEYKYSTTNDGDDWIFSPAIYLEAGKAYDFEATARAYGDKYPEKIEICLGTSANAESMTTKLVETTTILGSDTSLKAGVAPVATGEYHIGFHAVSDAGQWSLYLKKYSLSEPYSATAPAVVEQLKLTPDVTGALNVSISFVAPSTTVLGTPYTGDMQLIVSRDGKEIEKVTAAAGAAKTITDKVDAAGEYTYTVVSSTTAGETGRSASATVFVGPNVPNPPADVKAVENTAALGEVTLTWSHPQTDIAGNPLLPSNLTYNVYLYNAESDAWAVLNKEPLTDCTFTFRAQEADAPQTFIQVLIETLNCGVESKTQSGPGLVAVGAGYKLPVVMSCVDNALDYILGFDPWDGCEFGMKVDGDMSSVVSQDGDGQFFYGERTSSSATLGAGKGIGDFIFGKIDLAGAKNPVFSLYTWKITETDKTKLDIIVVCEGEQKLVSTVDYTDDTPDVWTKKVVDLAEFKDKAIQLIIRYHSDGLVYCFFDNMKFMDMPDYDLNAVSVEAPKRVYADEVFTVTATIENVGRLQVDSYEVELLANGKVVDTKAAGPIAAGSTSAVAFEQTINMASEKVVEYTARIVCSSDLDSSNDLTPKSTTVTRQDSNLPKVGNVSGKNTADGNVITWDAITADDLPFDPTVESFENAEPFTKEYAGWTFVDRDGRPCGGPGNIEVPNHTYGVDPESFIVIDGTYSSFATSNYAKEYLAADGKQYIASLWTKGETEQSITDSDDWAISPLLKGCAQTVTFAAKNGSINYSEFLQVWYATSDTTNPDDFEMVSDFNNYGYNYRLIRTDGWGTFTVDLPEGAVRMAFRCVSNDGMILMIDNVSYLAADATVGLEHKGYNLYCDGAKLNDAPIVGNTYTHSNPADTHTYHVTAVYNRGESEVSDPVLVSASGVGSIAAGAASITVEGHSIIVSGASDSLVSIVSADGKTIVSTTGDCKAAVAAGLYLVTIGDTTTKVAVR